MNENISVLVVDDNQDNLKVISNYLLKKDYKIALATDGESAFRILESNKIDLILLDIMMPGMDGFEVCAKLKAKKETMDIPVIFLSARSETDDIVKGFQTGGVDYVTKPFNKEELYARVNTHIQLKLAKDYLIQCEAFALNSRNQYMRTLYELGKILNRNK
jgi:two-component system, sensor histidine kinase and response regulator